MGIRFVERSHGSGLEASFIASSIVNGAEEDFFKGDD
jgi:hypothetical protein